MSGSRQSGSRQTDFLTRLAARALDQAPVLRPRLPSLFEAGTETGGPAPEPVIEAAAERRGPQAFAVEPASPAPAVPSAATATERNSAPQPPHGPAAPGAPEERAHDPGRRAEEAAPPAGRRGAPGQGAPPESPSPRRREPSRPTPGLPEVRITEVRSVEAQSTEGSGLGSVPALSRTGTAEPERVVSALRPVAPSGPTTPAVARGPAAQPRQATDAASEPTIQVTIGRIDVRAVHSAPEPPKAVREPAAPRVSLEDYLQRRKEGRR